MKAELQQLVALQNLDTSIRKLQAELEAIPERRAQIESEFDQRAFEIRALENRRDEARHTRTRLEIEVGEQRVRVERAERNLMSSKKQDEYTAAIREADAARKQIAALETQILEQMEALEQAEASLTERAGEIASLNSDREGDGVAVAEARNGACMACFMALRPQAMAQVRRGEEVVTCDNCNRILYYAPADSAPASSASAQPKMAHT